MMHTPQSAANVVAKQRLPLSIRQRIQGSCHSCLEYGQTDDCIYCSEIEALCLELMQTVQAQETMRHELPKYRSYEPPFDGKPCPMCPTEIRNLAATAHNFLTVWDDVGRHCILRERIDALRRAVAAVRPLSDKHFSDRKHSHGD
jgi:hypothetical protein